MAAKRWEEVRATCQGVFAVEVGEVAGLERHFRHSFRAEPGALPVFLARWSSLLGWDNQTSNLIGIPHVSHRKYHQGHPH